MRLFRLWHAIVGHEWEDEPGLSLRRNCRCGAHVGREDWP